jgi:hypothetical protein
MGHSTFTSLTHPVTLSPVSKEQGLVGGSGWRPGECSPPEVTQEGGPLPDTPPQGKVGVAVGDLRRQRLTLGLCVVQQQDAKQAQNKGD